MWPEGAGRRLEISPSTQRSLYSRSTWRRTSLTRSPTFQIWRATGKDAAVSKERPSWRPEFCCGLGGVLTIAEYSAEDSGKNLKSQRFIQIMGQSLLPRTMDDPTHCCRCGYLLFVDRRGGAEFHA